MNNEATLVIVLVVKESLISRNRMSLFVGRASKALNEKAALLRMLMIKFWVRTP